MTTQYLLIEHPDCCCGNCLKSVTVFSNPEHRDAATILLLNGGPIENSEQKEICMKQLDVLRENGKLLFEGDPPIEWLDANMQPWDEAMRILRLCHGAMLGKVSPSQAVWAELDAILRPAKTTPLNTERSSLSAAAPGSD